jgi:AAA+ superfamily predicted ATPase
MDDQTQAQAQVQNLLNSANVIGASNHDIANSIITNTLLSSMKTGSPLIDAITSLVFISNFKNQFFKNISIVAVLLLGIVFHRITKSVDILNTVYETLLSYYNPYVMIQYIPSAYLKNMLLKYNGNVLNIRIENKQSFFEIKQQYNLLTMFHKVIEKYPDIQRETLELHESIGYNLNPVNANLYRRLRSNEDYLSYTDFENKEQSKNLSIRVTLENLVKSPPKTGKWYKLEEDVQFNWIIVRSQPLQQNRDPNSSNNGATLSSNSSSNNNGTRQIDPGPFHYMLTLKSYVKTTAELQKYLDISRKELLDKLVKHEIDENVKQQERLNSLSNIDFRGEIYEVYEEEIVNNTNGNGNGNGNSTNTVVNRPKQYRGKLINTFCRPLESIFFKEKDQLMNILLNFKQRKGIYEKLPHRHKIGVMIYGKPGGGKTSLSVAIATELKRNIVRISLKDKNLDDAKLSHILNSYKKGYVIILDELDTHKAFRPRLVEEESSTDSNEGYAGYAGYAGGFGPIPNEYFGDESCTISDESDTEGKDGKDGLEPDLKHMIKKFKFKNDRSRKGWKSHEKLTLGSFLEAMDGISSTEERVVIAMTNHPKLLDPAIIRPGRFDIVINMDALDHRYMHLYFKYLFKDFQHITEQEIENACVYSTQNKVSTSSLEQACIEKYSVKDTKTLADCIKDVHRSFIF